MMKSFTKHGVKARAAFTKGKSIGGTKSGSGQREAKAVEPFFEGGAGRGLTCKAAEIRQLKPYF